MLYSIYYELKSFVKKKYIFLLLLIGMIVGAFSLIVYYVAGTEDLQQFDTMFLQDRTIEFKSNSSPMDGDILLNLINCNEIPTVDYASAISYDNSSYDIIGIYYKKENKAPEYGRYVNSNDMGQRVATVTNANEDIYVGDIYRVNGVGFEVVGTIKEYQYYASNYDLRRIPEGEEYVAGVDLARDESVLDRPSSAIFIPIDMLDDSNVIPSYFHITFNESLSDEQRAQVEQTLKIAFDNNIIEFTDMTPYSEIHISVRFTRLVIYSIAVGMGLINICAVFNYYLKTNRKNYVIYKMLGANNSYVSVMLIGTLFVICLVAFAIGMLFAWFFIQYSGLIDQHLPITILNLLLLFAIFFGIALLLSIKQIRETIQSSHEKRNLGKDIVRNLDGESSVSNKFLYLLSFRYNKSVLLQNISIIILSFICAFTFSFAFTYVVESKTYNRYVDSVYENDIGIFCAKESDFTNAIGLYLSDPTEENATLVLNYKEMLESMNGVHALGEMTFLPIFHVKDLDSNSYEIQIGSKDFWENSQYLLHEGSWQPVIEYAGEEVVPVIVNYDFGKEHPIDSKFELEIAVKEEYQIDSYDDDGIPHGYVFTEYSTQTFQVVGILREDAYYITGNADYQEFATIDHYLSHVENSVNNMSAKGYIFAPFFEVDGTSPVYTGIGNRIWYVFADGEIDNFLSQWNVEIEKIGEIDSFNDAIKNYEEVYKSGGGDAYFLHSFITSLMLLFGVGGYSLIMFLLQRKTYGIYYICGMQWTESVWLLLFGNAIEMLLPAIIGSVVGVVTSDTMRTFSMYTRVMSVIAGVTLVTVVYLVVGVIIAVYMRNKQPNRLIIEGK